jgi:hypothetical protein
MKLLRFVRPISSVSVACERLQILLACERNLVSQADLIRMTQTANGGQPRTIASAWNSSPEAVALVDAHQHLWWYHSAHTGQVGPLTVQELKDQLATNPDARRLFVWRDGMSEWRRAGDVRELHSLPARSSNIARAAANSAMREARPGPVAEIPARPAVDGEGGPQPCETMTHVARPIQPAPYPPAPAGEGQDGLRPELTPRLPCEPMPVEPAARTARIEPGARLAPPSNNTANRRGSAMSDVEIRKRVPLPADLVDDYRLPQVRAAEREAPLGPAMSEMSAETLPADLVDDYRLSQVRAAEREAPLGPAMSEMSAETLPADLDDYRLSQVRAAEREAPLGPAMSDLSAETAVNLRKLEQLLTRKPIDEIASLVQGLTYGEMIELAQAMWKAQPEGSAVTQENLPALLHCWSKSHPLAGH